MPRIASTKSPFVPVISYGSEKKKKPKPQMTADGRR
jgi:hypothetical protein